MDRVFLQGLLLMGLLPVRVVFKAPYGLNSKQGQMKKYFVEVFLADKLIQMACLVFRLGDNAPEILRDVCLDLGWKEYDEGDEENDWNLWWKTSGFRTSDFEACRPWQRLNHFPKSIAITRKDCLARNLRRMKGIYGNSVYNFIPLSFNLPNDYRKFVSEYTKQKEGGKAVSWICKPADQSRGKGIFIFRDLSELTYDCANYCTEVHTPIRC